MKRLLLSVMLLALLLQTTALAATKFSTSLFDAGKQGLTLLSYGEYKKALKAFGFSGDVTASDLSDFVETDLPELDTVPVQTDVAVAYRLDDVWRLAIPIEEPSYETVSTLVLRTKDGKHFNGYKAVQWSDVQNDLDSADSVLWQDAYEPGDLFLIPDQ